MFEKMKQRRAKQAERKQRINDRWEARCAAAGIPLDVDGKEVVLQLAERITALEKANAKAPVKD